MRRALRRAGWALATAGGIGLATPAGAQAPPVRLILPSGHVASADAPVAMTEAQAHLEEAQLELAFLADPMLFSYSLGAHVEGASIEVRGFVPTDEVRQRALSVAKQQSALPLVDKIELLPTLAGHGAVDKPDNIVQVARTLLAESFPEHGPALHVECDRHGRVTVTGTVASLEDKVLVSRKLRQVPGCSCVLNQLTVGTGRLVSRPAETPRSSEAKTGVSAPVHLVPPVAEPAIAPLHPVAMPEKKDPAPPPTPPVQPTPAPLPPLKTLPADPAPACVLPPPALIDIPLPPASVELPKPMPVKKETPAPLPPLPETSKLVLPPISVPDARPPVPDQHQTGRNEESYVTEGVITFGEDPPAPKPVRVMATRSTPAVAIVAFTPPPVPARVDSTVTKVLPAPPSPVRPVLTPALRLKHLLQEACGPAYTIKVTTRDKDRLYVAISARDPADEHRLLERIKPILNSREFISVAIDVDIGG